MIRASLLAVFALMPGACASIDGAPPSRDAGGCTTNADCRGAREFCDTSPACPPARGQCVPRPDMCAQVFQPVTGCDGKRYSNGCMANEAGVAVKAPSSRPSP